MKNSNLPTLDKYKEYMEEVAQERQDFLKNTETTKRKINLIAENFLQVKPR